jgi:hypothetical protein
MGREDQGRAILPFRLPIANCQFPIEKGTHLPKPKCASFVAASAILECSPMAGVSLAIRYTAKPPRYAKDAKDSYAVR